MPLEDRWVDRPFAVRHWADAADLDDATLDELLEATEDQVRAYAPEINPVPIPLRWRLASVYQAREIRAAALRNEADAIGVGDFVIRPRPLTSTVKSLLRPESAVPQFGAPPAETTP